MPSAKLPEVERNNQQKVPNYHGYIKLKEEPYSP